MKYSDLSMKTHAASQANIQSCHEPMCISKSKGTPPKRDLGSGTLGPIYPQGGSIQMSLTTLNGPGCHSKTWTSVEVCQSIAGGLKHWLLAESCLSHVRAIKVLSILEEEGP